MQTESNLFTDPHEATLKKLAEGFDLLVELHQIISYTPGKAAAKQHLDNASRELAAVQKLFDRRSRSR